MTTLVVDLKRAQLGTQRPHPARTGHRPQNDARELNRLGAVETMALGIDLDLSTKSDEQVRARNIRIARQCGRR